MARRETNLDHLTKIQWMSPAGELHTVWTTPERAEQLKVETAPTRTAHAIHHPERDRRSPR